jgi:signal transduction histidine kinase
MESERMVFAGAIASTVAHDLKGPLNTILNAVYLMDAKPEKAAQMKEIIVNAVDNASKMLEEARGRTTSRGLSLEELDIASFIESIVEETPIDRRIELKTDLQHFSIEIDRLRMRRAIENLIRNAIDAMPSKGTLLLTSRKEGEKGVIEVKDTGTGIPNEMLGKLFTPFNTTKEKGTGLGLHYCKNTLEEHGGSIEVNSKAGSGTTFILRIPLRQRLVVQNSLSSLRRS